MKNRLLRIRSLVALCSGALVAALLPIGAAAHEEVDLPPVEPQQSEEALEEDVAVLAEAFGVAPQEALLHYEREVQLSEFVASLDKSAMSYFAGAWIEQLPSSQAHIRFTSEFHSDRVDQLDAPPWLTIINDRERTLAELRQIADETQATLLDSGLRQHMGYVEVETGRVVVVYSEPEARDRMAEHVLADLAKFDHMDIRPTDEGRVFEETHTYGGAQMRLNGSNKCTSAFTVSSDNGLGDGVLTAAHCTVNEMYSPPHGYAYSAPWKAEHLGYYGDMEWHTTTHSEYANFYHNGTSLRAVVNLKLNQHMTVGNSVCRYGYKTGKTCGAVTGVAVWLGSNGNFVTATQPILSDGGDSGGPWFYSTMAWGIHGGNVVSTGHGYFSTVHHAENRLDVTLKTQ